MPEDILKELANPTNQAVLSLLAIEPAYPRRVANLLGVSESDVSRRLNRMERAGLVRSGWEHLDGRNVKTYELVAREVQVRFGSEGIAVTTDGGGEDGADRVVVDRLRVQVPEADGFVGRERELEVLGGEDPVVLVEGLPGIGKTSLVSAYARREMEERHVFYHGFSGTESLTWLAHRLAVFHARRGNRDLLDAIERGTSLPHRRDLALDALAGTGAVVVLDEAERIRDEDLQRLLADAIHRTPRGKLVVAGRQLPRVDPSTDHVHRLRLTGLPEEDVSRLLGERGVDATDEMVRGVHRKLGGHPLALHLFAEAAARADGDPRELLDRVPDHETEVYLLEEVDEDLSEAERRVLAHASVFRSPFSREDLEAVYPGNPGGAHVKLHRRRLLREEGGRFRLHDLLRVFFQERLADPAAVDERAAEHALGKGTLEARLDAMHHLLEAGRERRVLELLDEDLDLEELDLITEGYHSLYLDVLQQLDPDAMAEPERAGLVHDELGDIHHHRGEHEAALEHYAEAATRLVEAEAATRLADLAWKRALALRALGRREEAARLVEEGLVEHAPDERTRKRLRNLGRDLDLEL